MYSKTFEKLWYINDYDNAFKEYKEFLSDDKLLDGASCIEEKLADSIFYLDHLLEAHPVLFMEINAWLNELSKDNNIRFTIFAGIIEALKTNPSLYYHQKEIINDIIFSNLDTKIGIESLIQVIIHYFDDFDTREKQKIVKSLENNPILKKGTDPVLNIGLSLLKFLDSFIAKEDLDKIKATLGREVNLIEAPKIYIDATDIRPLFYCIFNILTGLKNFIFDFRGFENILKLFEKKYPNRDFLGLFFTHKFWDEYLELNLHLMKNIFNILYNPVFLSPNVSIENIQESLDQINTKLRDFVLHHHNDNLYRFLRKKGSFVDLLKEIPLKTMNILQDFANYAILLKKLFNFDDPFEDSEKNVLLEYNKRIEANINYIYFIPIRIAYKHLYDLMKERQESYLKIREILDSILNERKRIVTILGPFSDKDPKSNVNEKFTSIAIWLANLPKQYKPVFIPWQYQGITNAILFDLYVQMSNFIICLYIPSKSAGHIDEVARILERRNAPPIVLISNCEFPTTTQVDGIIKSKFVEIFCFNDSGCSYKEKCFFKNRCKDEGFPKATLEKALEAAMEWIEKL